MRFAFFAREPILDRNHDLFAYSLDFRDGTTGSVPNHPPEKQREIEERFEALDLNSISRANRSLVEFTDSALQNNLEGFDNTQSIIINLRPKQIQTPEIFENCKNLKTKGIQIALQVEDCSTLDASVIELLDIIIIDAAVLNNDNALSSIQMFVEDGKRHEIKFLSTNIHEQSEFDRFNSIGFDYFQGYFFIKLSQHDSEALPTSKLSILNLVSACASPEFDINAVVDIIERDASISYALLKFINNPLINKRMEITSLQHAVAFLGEIEVKKFVALISVINLTTGQNPELLTVSLVRAKYIELLYQETGEKSHQTTGFLLGLLSLLDVILSKPMPDVVDQIAITLLVKETLLGEETEYKPVMDLIKGFESALWGRIIEFSKSHAISQTKLHRLFNQAITWSNEITDASSNYFPQTKVS